MGTEASAEDVQVTCKFTTRLPAEYKVPATAVVRSQAVPWLAQLLETTEAASAPLHLRNPDVNKARTMQAEPAKLTRYGLSQVVNHLLGLGAGFKRRPKRSV